LLFRLGDDGAARVTSLLPFPPLSVVPLFPSNVKRSIKKVPNEKKTEDQNHLSSSLRRSVEITHPMVNEPIGSKSGQSAILRLRELVKAFLLCMSSLKSSLSFW